MPAFRIYTGRKALDSLAKELEISACQQHVATLAPMPGAHELDIYFKQRRFIIVVHITAGTAIIAVTADVGVGFSYV